MKPKDRSAAFITWAGAALIFLFAMLPPGIYLVMGVNQAVGNLESKAEIGASQVTRVINLNPEYWVYEKRRIAELLTQDVAQNSSTSWQVTDSTGDIIYQSPHRQKRPFLERSHTLYDFGQTAGQIEVRQSIFELVRGSAILGLSTLSAGFLAFFLFRRRALLFLTKAERNVRESERKYRQLFNAETDAILLLNGQTRKIVDANTSALRLYGYTREGFLGLDISAISAEPEKSEATIAETVKRGRMTIPLRYHVKKDGTVFPIEISAGTFRLQGRNMICAIVRDITARKEDEQKLLSYQGQLRALALKLSSAEERERRELAMVLHDEVGQLLAMTRLNLEDAAGKGGRSGVVRDPEQARSLLGQAIARTRSLTWELSSQSLYDLGLEAAVEELCETFEKRFGLRCVLAREKEETVVPEPIRGTIYRAIREILNNVLKHAGATRAEVGFSSHRGWLQVTVADNGRGFDTNEVTTTPTHDGRFGLFSIQERMNLLGGSLRIGSAFGGGAKVTLRVPLEHSAGGKGA